MRTRYIRSEQGEIEEFVRIGVERQVSQLHSLMRRSLA